MPFLLLSAALSQKLAVVLLAAIPLAELRGSMPYAMFVFKMKWQEAIVLSVIGNFIPVIPFLLFLEAFAHRLMKYPAWNKLFTWSFNRTRKRSSVIERFEAIGLALFVGVPLPLTGAWSGCIAAFLFRIPLRLAIPAITAGILIAGVVVTLVCLGLLQASFFLGHWGTK